MSYNLTLDCGCLVYVACHPVTSVPHTRVIERRNTRCGIRKHDVGVRLAVWELLPERRDRVRADVMGWRAEDTLSGAPVPLVGRQRPVSREKPAD
jgi:hypothetical protein